MMRLLTLSSVILEGLIVLIFIEFNYKRTTLDEFLQSILHVMRLEKSSPNFVALCVTFIFPTKLKLQILKNYEPLFSTQASCSRSYPEN